MKSPLHCPSCGRKTLSDDVFMVVGLVLLGICARLLWRDGLIGMALFAVICGIMGSVGYFLAGAEHRERCRKNGGLG